MKKIILISFCVLVFISCEKEKKLSPNKYVEEAVTFSIKKIPDSLAQIPTDPNKAGLETTKPQLDVPKDLTDRSLLDNGAGYRDNLNMLVGMVVKKKIVDGKTVYSAIKDYKKNPEEIKAITPTNGLLVEKKYDSKASAELSYLIASVKLERTAAYQILISDVSKAIVSDKDIDLDAMYTAYANDSELDNYEVVMVAISTSILNKKFLKMDAGAKFDAAAIKVGTNYYTENTDLKQDWLVGLYVTPLKELFKGMPKPPTN